MDYFVRRLVFFFFCHEIYYTGSKKDFVRQFEEKYYTMLNH